MDQRARMWKTLGFLVAAMTGTSVLLGWMDPSPRPVSDAPSPSEIERWARLVVGVESGIDLQTGRWDDIEIVPAPGSPAGGSMLAAGHGSTSYHFHVDRRGRPTRAKRWREQAATDGLPHTVRIEVAPLAGAQPLSTVQCFCVRALVAALNDALASGGPSLPVRLPPAWEDVIDIERAMGELLSSVTRPAD